MNYKMHTKTPYFSNREERDNAPDIQSHESVTKQVRQYEKKARVILGTCKSQPDRERLRKKEKYPLIRRI